MKPLFKNITKYTKKSYDEFLIFHKNKYGLRYIILTSIITALIIYCSISSFISKQYVLGLVFILLIIAFLEYRIYLPIYRYKNAFKKKNEKDKNVFTFSFYNNYFKIDNEKIYYFSLHKIFETEDFFYLYITKENAALVNKKGFKIGNPDSFSEFIKKKCKFKYYKEDAVQAN